MGRYKLDYWSIIQNVKTLRKAKNISQLQLAELADLSLNTISKFEINQKRINLETFIKVANALDVDVNLLLGSSRTSRQRPVDSVIISLLEDFTDQDKELLVPIMTAMRFYSKSLNDGKAKNSSEESLNTPLRKKLVQKVKSPGDEKEKTLSTSQDPPVTNKLRLRPIKKEDT